MKFFDKKKDESIIESIKLNDEKNELHNYLKQKQRI